MNLDFIQTRSNKKDTQRYKYLLNKVSQFPAEIGMQILVEVPYHQLTELCAVDTSEYGNIKTLCNDHYTWQIRAKKYLDLDLLRTLNSEQKRINQELGLHNTPETRYVYYVIKDFTYKIFRENASVHMNIKYPYTHIINFMSQISEFKQIANFFEFAQNLHSTEIDKDYKFVYLNLSDTTELNFQAMMSNSIDHITFITSYSKYYKLLKLLMIIILSSETDIFINNIAMFY